MPPLEPILAAFSTLARSQPHTPLVICGDREVTARDLDELARSCSEVVAEHGLEPGEIVALAAGSAPGFLAAFVAVRRAGCTALLLDSASPAAERSRIARSMGACGILDSPSVWPERGGAFQFVGTDLQQDERRQVEPDVAVIKLTSGSTGRPRGILTPSEALVADDAALATTMGLRADERILASVPLSHSYGMSSIVMPALMRGSTVVVPTDRSPISPMLTADRQGVTFLPTVPARLGGLVRLSSPPPLPESVRLVISAGAPLPPETAARFRATFGRPVHVFYGSSECGGICYDREGTAAELGSVGTPVDGARVTLNGKGKGSGGTVSIESAAVGRSYYPEPTERLHDGCYHSHDLGRWEDGRLVLTGRVDDLVNVRGKNVNPREVEEVLSQHEGVDEAAVLGAPTVDGGEVLRAVVACAPGRISELELRAWCRHHLSDYKVPRSLILVESLPRTARGKVDRSALRELSSSPKPS